jgi:hypothetical protein
VQAALAEDDLHLYRSQRKRPSVNDGPG